MTFSRKVRFRALAILTVLQAVISAPAEAAYQTSVSPEMAILIQAITTNMCLVYVYDLNGNVLSTNSVGYSSTATWGSSTFGCFTW